MKSYPDVIDPLHSFRERAVVHLQRFGETLMIVQDKLNEKPFYVKKHDSMNVEPALGVSPAAEVKSKNKPAFTRRFLVQVGFTLHLTATVGST